MAIYVRTVLLALSVFGTTTASGTSASSGSTTNLRRRSLVESSWNTMISVESAITTVESEATAASIMTTDTVTSVATVISVESELSSASNSMTTYTGMSVVSEDTDTYTATQEIQDLTGYYLHLDKTVLQDPNEPLEVTFKLPQSALATSRDHSEWSIGVYMRRARPQEGSLQPITALKLCGLESCLHQDIVHDGSQEEAHVTFDYTTVEAMTGESATWPLDLKENGDGFDVFLLDDKGSAVLGPMTFTVVDPTSDDTSTTSVQGGASQSGVKRYDHTHHSHSASSTTVAAEPTSTLVTSGKSPVIVSFILESDLTSEHTADEMAKWSIGIFMRRGNPQGGDLDPIISLPMCADCESENVVYEGEVVFSANCLAPLHTNEYGTGFDVWILDESGNGEKGPFHFINIVEDETSSDSEDGDVTDIGRK